MTPRSALVAVVLAAVTGGVTGWAVPTAAATAGGAAALGAAGYAALSPARVVAWRGALPLAAALVLAPYARFALADTPRFVFVGQAVATKVVAGAVLAAGYVVSRSGGRRR
jgi:hypothetical protein